MVAILSDKVVHRASDSKGNHIGHFLWCPGCNEPHMFDFRWTFNGDMDKPTFSPSYLATTKETRCHSHVVDGQWKYLNDCTHAMAGQTVDVPLEWPHWKGLRDDT